MQQQKGNCSIYQRKIDNRILRTVLHPMPVAKFGPTAPNLVIINGPIILLATFFLDTLYDHRVQYLQKHLRQHNLKWDDLHLPLFGVTSSISGIVSPDP